METTDLLQTAIQARLNGYNLIPLRGGVVGSDGFKRPSIPWEKYQSELSTISDIRKWETENPELRFGIVTGPVSKLFVLDLDNEAAMAWFDSHERSASFLVKTNKGCHLYYKWSEGLAGKSTTRVRIADGVDVRGDGGYVVAWNLKDLPGVAELPNVPQWLVDMLPNKDANKTTGIVTPSTGQNWLRQVMADIKDGNRNNRFTQIAGSLRARGYQPEIIFELLKPKAKEVGFPESELKTICISVGRYDVVTNTAANNGASDKLSEFLAIQEKTEWLIPDLLAKESINMFAGLPGTGKTWMLMDLAVEAARETGLWLGRFPVEKSKVLYIDQERSAKETRRRFAALIQNKEINPKSLDGMLDIKCATTIRIDLQHSYEAFHKELSEKRPGLVIVDSFKTFTTKNINDQNDMQAVMERIKELRTEFKCTFVFVYHENKMAYSRGEADNKNKREDITAEFMAGASVLSEVPESIVILDSHGVNESFCHHVKNNLGDRLAPFLINIQNVVPDRSKIVVRVI